MTAAQPADKLAPLYRDAMAVLGAWTPPSGQQARLHGEYLNFLRDLTPAQALLKGGPEHLTASTLIMSSDGAAALLTLHRKAGRWLQTGGHCEPDDPSLAAAALREAREESGIEGLTLLPGPLLLDRHELSAGFGACRVHWDVRYAAVAPRDAATATSEESMDLRWFELAEIPAPPGERLRELAGVAAALVRGSSAIRSPAQ